MITLKDIPLATRHYTELYGDSTETKPMENIAEGSTFIETDTGDVYMFNVRLNAWIKQFSLQG